MPKPDYSDQPRRKRQNEEGVFIATWNILNSRSGKIVGIAIAPASSPEGAITTFLEKWPSYKADRPLLSAKQIETR